MNKVIVSLVSFEQQNISVLFCKGDVVSILFEQPEAQHFTILAIHSANSASSFLLVFSYLHIIYI